MSYNITWNIIEETLRVHSKLFGLFLIDANLAFYHIVIYSISYVKKYLLTDKQKIEICVLFLNQRKNLYLPIFFLFEHK